jgi:hypothetical protein
LLCRSNDLARINVAFFQMNALVGLILVIGVGASIFEDRLPFHVSWNDMIFVVVPSKGSP